VKHKCHRRKILWDLILILVRGGLTAQVAVDQICGHHGPRADSVTLITSKMKNDRRNGTVFSLQTGEMGNDNSLMTWIAIRPK
jgi:hypothetical protein